MPTLSKTWQFDISRSYSWSGGSYTILQEASWFLWYILKFLTGQVGGATLGLWTVYQSCDAAAYGTPGDGVDRWSTAPTNSTGAHGWAVLRSPVLPDGQRVYLVLNCSNTTLAGVGAGSTGWVQIYCSRTPPTASQSTSSPGTVPGDCFPAPSANSGTVNCVSDVATRHICGGLTTDGTGWYIAASKDGTGKVETALIFSFLTNTKVNDSYPYWFFQANDSANGACVPTNLTMMQLSSARTHTCRTWNGASEMNCPVVLPYVANGQPCVNTGAVNATDPADNSYFDFPLWVGFANSTTNSLAAGGAQFKGTVTDFAIGPTQCPQGSVDGAPGSITSMFLGNVWFPSNSAPTL